MDRRRFLETGAAALAGGLLASCTDVLAPAEETPGALSAAATPLEVAVVGAGLAGLVAAWELRRAGHRVTVFEARPRVGGRVLTLRAPFADGHLAEAGAARIPPEHDLTLGYAAWFGLPLGPFHPEEGAYLVWEGGTLSTRTPASFLGPRTSWQKLTDGSDTLPRAFAGSFGGDLRPGTPVEAVLRPGDEAVVVPASGPELVADRVLCTVPLPVLDRIAFDPPLSEARRAAHADFAYQTATRVFVPMARRFWEDAGLSGWGRTDWPEELWHPTWDRPGPGGVLMTYVRGERARFLDALPEEERIRATVDHWSGFLPAVASHARGGASHSWALDPWAGAAWAEPTASQSVAHAALLASPEGPIHFAGEHLSDDRGWMQGALASGIRAAREIHASA